MQNPKVSVVIPAYNAGKYIRQTLESVFAQSLQDFEIIVVNDGSSDDTMEVLGSIEDPRLSVLSQSNGGVSRARNAGIAQSVAPYVYFLDSDDVLLPDALEQCYATLASNSDLVAVYGEVIVFDTDLGIPASRKPEKVLAPRPSGEALEGFLGSNPVACGSCIMASKAALNKTNLFNPSIKLGEDWALWIELAGQGHVAHLKEVALCYYRHHPTSAARTLSLDPAAMDPAINYIFALDIVRGRLSDKQIKVLRNNARANAFTYTAQETLKARNWPRSRKFAWASLSLRVRHLRTWVLLVCSLLQYIPPPIARQLK